MHYIQYCVRGESVEDLLCIFFRGGSKGGTCRLCPSHLAAPLLAYNVTMSDTPSYPSTHSTFIQHVQTYVQCCHLAIRDELRLWTVLPSSDRRRVMMTVITEWPPTGSHPHPHVMCNRHVIQEQTTVCLYTVQVVTFRNLLHHVNVSSCVRKKHAVL